MTNHVLVTGGAGFIGSHIAELSSRLPSKPFLIISLKESENGSRTVLISSRATSSIYRSCVK